ncbi:hypothetical protein [Insolitispirillum peregrinum]|uniref:Uncharacterized protein n=1 Tax=Insolitispirillum peregrinum TaxID=80876 RepID=A0A1N7MJN8_9PROT|nr:hypothetical protein [Insolitispirillum peregrinum]SIS86356.1 hypothetical protein SAMN05421779_104173 [Insolitispirillum peregrinum]
MSNRARLSTAILTIGDASGDGPVLKLIPPPVKSLVRTTANRLTGQRKARLLRVAAEIYPILQKIEDRALPDSEKKLQGVPFLQALTDDEKIERGLRMFVSAWKSNIIRLNDDKGKPIPPSKGRTHMTACGLTVDQAQIFFIDMALELIFKANSKAKRQLLGTIHNPAAIGKLRVMSVFQPLALTELVMGLGYQAGDILAEANPDVLYALAMLKAFHMRALRQAFGAGFRNVFDWSPDTIKAVAENFNCVEQVRDLGDAIGLIRDPQALIVLGKWEVRDITDKVNEERAARGLPEVKGHRFETDIAAGRSILGPYFNTLIENPPELLVAFGKIVSQIRQADKIARKERIDEVRLFCDRFMEYISTDTMKALGIVGEKPTGFGEALNILEGLFSKPGLGRRFFEGPLQTPEGIKAIAGLKADLDDMRKRGSIKGDAEIGQLIANSDILDRCIVPFLNFSMKN